MSDPRAYVGRWPRTASDCRKARSGRKTVPEGLVAAVTSAVQGHAPQDSEVPIAREADALAPRLGQGVLARRRRFFVRKARWPGGCAIRRLPHPRRGQHLRARGHIWRTRARFSLGDLIGGLMGAVSLYDNVDLIASQRGVAGLPLELLLPLLELPALQSEADLQTGYAPPDGRSGFTATSGPTTPRRRWTRPSRASRKRWGSAHPA